MITSTMDNAQLSKRVYCFDESGIGSKMPFYYIASLFEETHTYSCRWISYNTVGPKTNVFGPHLLYDIDLHKEDKP